MAIFAGALLRSRPYSFRSPASASDQLCTNLHEVVCAPLQDRTDPTGRVRSELEMTEFVQSQLKSLATRLPRAGDTALRSKFIDEIATPKKRARMREAFHWTQRAIEALIESQPNSVFTPVERMQLLTRVRRVQLLMPPPASIYADDPDLMMRANAIYERLRNGNTRIRVGGGLLLGGESWFDLVSMFAHELGHSIDPCEIKDTGTFIPAFARVTDCFVQSGLVPKRIGIEQCGTHDSLSETFADWISAQITAKALTIFASEYDHRALGRALSNSVRDLCDPDDPSLEYDTSEHPSAQIRISAIFGRNPTILDLLGCPRINSNPAYCTLSSP